MVLLVSTRLRFGTEYLLAFFTTIFLMISNSSSFTTPLLFFSSFSHLFSFEHFALPLSFIFKILSLRYLCESAFFFWNISSFLLRNSAQTTRIALPLFDNFRLQSPMVGDYLSLFEPFSSRENKFLSAIGQLIWLIVSNFFSYFLRLYLSLTCLVKSSCFFGDGRGCRSGAYSAMGYFFDYLRNLLMGRCQDQSTMQWVAWLMEWRVFYTSSSFANIVGQQIQQTTDFYCLQANKYLDQQTKTSEADIARVQHVRVFPL